MNPSQATAASAPQPGASWGLRNDPDLPSFPLGGSLLLLALLAVALWAWWSNHRRGAGWPWGTSTRQGDKSPSQPQVLHGQRLDATTRLYVLRWHGQELLVCVAPQAQPAVLATHPASSPGADA